MTEIWIDVREYVEYAAGHISGVTLVPLSTVRAASAGWDREQPLMIVCKSGRRAATAKGQLEELGFRSVTVLPGGMDAWAEAGKPIEVVERRPWAMERQVRVVAGSLVVIFTGLGWMVSRYVFLGAGLVGAGLVFAGVSNTCMMASVLAKMPWNRVKI